MKYRDNIKAVAALKPDYMGFIFYDKSARFFNSEIPEFPKSIKKVGVFVDASVNEILEKIRKYDLQTIQLHGSESPEFCAELKLKLSFLHRQESIKKPTPNDKNPAYAGMTEIIKVFFIKNKFDFSILEPYEAVCDFYLFDTKGKQPGGNGTIFNWEVLKKYPSIKPYFLSGGIGIDQISNIKVFQQSEASKYCYAIDVNSKFETKPGLKRLVQLKEFSKSLLFL